METINRFFKPPKQSFFLFGPRGTRKSTLVRRHFKDAIYLDLLDPEVFRTYSPIPNGSGKDFSHRAKVRP